MLRAAVVLGRRVPLGRTVPCLPSVRPFTSATRCLSGTVANTPASDRPWHQLAATATPRRRANNRRKEFLRERIQGLLSKPLVVVVQYGDLDADEWLDFRYELRQKGVAVTAVPNRVAGSIAGESMAGLFASSAAVVHADTVNFDFLSLLEDSKKVHVVGGRLEGTLMTPSDLKACQKLGDLDTQRATLVHVLAQPAARLAGLLGAQQSQLVGMLGRIEDDQ
eukprot:m.9433 g.9433  ORF g.9433 m.9433 type:complete len:222 (+) comp3512_c0_seq1:207-872(+)